MSTTDVILHIPDQRDSVSENDSDLQDVEETEDSSDSTDSSLGVIEQDEDSDIQNLGISEANKDEEQLDDIGPVGSPLKRRETIASALFFKSYFKRTKQDVNKNTAGTVVRLKCIKEASPPVTIDFFSNSVEWTFEPHELDVSKEYELIIGVSIKSVILASDIKEVILTVNQTDKRLEHETLKDTMYDRTNILRWKLCTPVQIHHNNKMMIALAFKLGWKIESLKKNAFQLHYMELHAVDQEECLNDPPHRVHRPCFDWILDIRGNGRDGTTKKYTISESGHYLATYSASSIELWDMTSGLQPTIAQQPTKSASLPPSLCGRTRPLCTSATGFENLSLSISWDGSQLITSGKGSPFKLYRLNRQKSMLEYSSRAENTGLITFEGRGIFHKGTRSQGQDPEKEIFVAMYQNTIEIYSVYGSWNRLRIIHHTSPITSDCVLEGWPVSRDMGDTIQGRRFISWNIDADDMIRSILVWNLDSGRLLCTIEAAGHNLYDNGSLSSDGSLLVEEIGGEIVRYCAHTGVRIDTSGASIGGVVSIRGGNSLLRTSDGLVRTGKDLIPIYPSCKLPESARVLSISKNGELFTALVKDRSSIFQQTWKSSPCNEDCITNLETAKKKVWSFIDIEYGLKFSVNGSDIAFSPSLNIVITDLSQKKTRVVVLKWANRGFAPVVTFSSGDRALIVEGHDWTWVYGMPMQFSDDISLMSVQDQNDQHMTCIHERSYFRSHLGCSSLLQLKLDQLETCAPALVRSDQYWNSPFLNDVHFLRYINRQINQRDGCGAEDVIQSGHKMSMMERLCREWFIDDEETALLEHIISLPECQWVPTSNMDFNPLEYFLKYPKTVPQSKTMVRLLYEYCLKRAAADRTTLFLSPISACLPILLDPDLPHMETAKESLQKMAFFPVPLRSIIIERHAVIHPPEFRVKFWNPNPRPLFKCKEPILQMESSGSSVVDIDDTKDAFREEIFAATFNMIWTDKSEPDTLKDTAHPAGVSPLLYWITMAPFAFRHKFNPWLEKVVVCHKFPPEALDNPALSALILYKWRTLGFYIWLFRFSFQCLFYALVIVTAFLQVYTPMHDSIMFLSGVIGVISGAFLLLELSQAVRDPYRYFGSLIYNAVDIAVFALPFGGCINQFNLRSTVNEDNVSNPRGPNSWLFSFSILVIALHLLFELRVNRTVCRFVTAIVRIFSKIQIFFIIFIIGLLAFTTALLHLLRGCVQEPCAELTTSFPGNYYLAFSATFFFMGGKYDPISDVFTQPNWAFHTMMIIYLIFTVILMLNVLIALINSGYDESDRTWELVWLQNRLLYIESAENLSHSIPGFRENYDIFPREIYYCLPEAKIQEYKSRWKKSDGQLSVEERKEDILERRVRSLKKQINEDRLTLLLMKGGRMDKLEKQLKRIEEMLRDLGAETGSETDKSIVDESDSDE